MIVGRAAPDQPTPRRTDNGTLRLVSVRATRRGRAPAHPSDALHPLKPERLVQAERVVIGLGRDHETPDAAAGGAAGSLYDETRADPSPTICGSRVDGLKAPPLASDDDPAGSDDFVAGIRRHVPRPSARAEQGPKIFEPAADELPVDLLN